MEPRLATYTITTPVETSTPPYFLKYLGWLVSCKRLYTSLFIYYIIKAVYRQINLFASVLPYFKLSVEY